MIYKIPIYVELKVEGDFVPSELNAAVDKFVSRKVSQVMIDYGGFPHTDTDLVDSLARDVKKAAKLKKVQISLVPRSVVLQKVVDRD